MRKVILIGVQVVMMAVLLAPPAQAVKQDMLNSSAFFNPMGPGPHLVGVTTTVLVDNSRTDNFTKEPRTLVTEIWYPAADDARKAPKNKYSDFIPSRYRRSILRASRWPGC